MAKGDTDRLRAMRERNAEARESRVINGLQGAVAYAQGDKSKGRTTIVTVPKSQKLQEAKQAVESVSHKAVINASPKATVLSTETNATRQAKWRSANTETHRERSRASMQKLRAKKKDNGTAS